MFTALLVEDNEAEGIKLSKVLKKIQPQMKTVLCHTGEEAIEHMKTYAERIDIFFIDRALPGMDGLELASKIRGKEEYVNTPIVFVTRYDSHLVDIFQEYHCYSYILKPYNWETMNKSLGNLLEHLGEKNKAIPLRKVVFLLFREGEGFVYADDILYLEKKNHDCLVCTKKKDYQIPRKSLEKQLEEIDNPYMIRCHKSFAVNLSNVKEIEKNERNIWNPIFVDGIARNCEISKTYYEDVMNRFREIHR